MDEAPSDPKPAFHKSFTSDIKSLEDIISNIATLRGSSQQDAISQVLSKISVLTHDLKDAANYLPAYDQRIYSEQLKSTTEALNAARKSAAPRTKFSFKNRRAGAIRVHHSHSHSHHHPPDTIITTNIPTTHSIPLTITIIPNLLPHQPNLNPHPATPLQPPPQQSSPSPT
ncbi:hypothetical protein TWF281_011521 [Arthrobotrys megalospora]